MHPDHLLAAVTQALTRLSVHVEKGLVLVEKEKTIRGMIDEAAKARFRLAQLILCPLAFGDIAHQAQEPTSALLKLADADLHREGGPVLALVASLESDRFPSDNALPQTLNGCLVQTESKSRGACQPVLSGCSPD